MRSILEPPPNFGNLSSLASSRKELPQRALIGGRRSCVEVEEREKKSNRETEKREKSGVLEKRESGAANYVGREGNEGSNLYNASFTLLPI